MRRYFVAYEGSDNRGVFKGRCQVEVQGGDNFNIRKVEKELKAELGADSLGIAFYKLMAGEEVFE